MSLRQEKLLWTYTLPPAGYETPYGTYPISGGGQYFPNGVVITVADGKLYAVTGDHTPNSPYWLGGAMYCVNASTGDLVFKISGWWSQYPAIVDGYAFDHNCYEGAIYCFGKGPTKTTVSTPDTAQPLGTTVLIKGRVLDVSPGAKDIGVAWNFPEGLPALADESMTAWMEYVYMQKPMPANVKGVWVSFDAIAPNGTWIHIGGTHTDSYGMYSVMWKPPTEGLWTFVATFPGSESYWPSYAQTSIGVTAAPLTPETPEIPTPIDYSPYLAALAIAIIIIAILVVYNIVAIRKMLKK
jgi:hypothetical protein